LGFGVGFGCGLAAGYPAFLVQARALVVQLHTQGSLLGTWIPSPIGA